MFPANENAPLPEVFKYAVKPDKVVTLDPKEIKNNYSRWLGEWTKLMIEGKSADEIVEKRE